jgi:hypothetical protein
MPNVTPERLREMANREHLFAEDALRLPSKTPFQRAVKSESYCWHRGRESSLREIADMLEEQERAAAFLVIPHDPNYRCWGK